MRGIKYDSHDWQRSNDLLVSSNSKVGNFLCHEGFRMFLFDWKLIKRMQSVAGIVIYLPLQTLLHLGSSHIQLKKNAWKKSLLKKWSKLTSIQRVTIFGRHGCNSMLPTAWYWKKKYHITPSLIYAWAYQTWTKKNNNSSTTTKEHC